MGRSADAVQARLRDALADRCPGLEWSLERRIRGTPVDVVGEGEGRLVALELEWRRADPADNTAKLFRHLAAGSVEAGRVDVVQVFTGYFDLDGGGVSSKRANAEFVGEAAADALEGVTYAAVDLAIDPPRGGDGFDEAWTPAIDAAADRIVAAIG